MKVWMVRAGKQGQDEATALDQGVAVIGFKDFPDLSRAKNKDEIYSLCRGARPDEKDSTVQNWVNQLAAFALRMQRGDIVALPLKSRPHVALGRVKGPYTYQEINGEMRHTRPVEWIRPDVPRSDIQQDLLYSLGAFLTVCRIQRNDADQRFEAMLAGQRDPGTEPTAEAEHVTEAEGPLDIEQVAQDQIMAHIDRYFKGHGLARLVDAILQAEGFVTKMSSPGPDGGVDILAGRGSLGFECPRLCVQVKSSTSAADVTILRSLIGTMQSFSADQGLLVSWGGFTRAVEQEARQAFFSVRLWDAASLLAALYRNYDGLPEDLQAELPLKRLWALVLEE